jgi:hypothetical protein
MAMIEDHDVVLSVTRFGPEWIAKAIALGAICAVNLVGRDVVQFDPPELALIGDIPAVAWAS